MTHTVAFGRARRRLIRRAGWRWRCWMHPRPRQRFYADLRWFPIVLASGTGEQRCRRGLHRHLRNRHGWPS